MYVCLYKMHVDIKNRSAAVKKFKINLPLLNWINSFSLRTYARINEVKVPHYVENSSPV